MKMSHLLIKKTRERLEGLLFVILCWIFGVERNTSRLMNMSRVGMRDVRLALWPLFVLERYRDLWRYIVLIEKLEQKSGCECSLQKTKYVRSKERVLLVRMGHFGDTLHIIPLLRGLKQSRPDLILELVVGPWTADLVRRIPYVDNIIVYAPRLEHLNRGWTKDRLSLSSEYAFGLSLRDKQYDSLVITYGTGLVETFLIAGARARQWIGPRPDCGLYLDLNSMFVEAPFEKNLYEAERVAGLARYFDARISDFRLEYWIKPDEERVAAELLRRSGVEKQEHWIVMCPGAGWSGKQWPVERYAAVGRELIRMSGCKVILCGSSAERSLCCSLNASMEGMAIDLSGKTGWGELAVLIRDARLFIGGDSGPMHLAAVYSVPAVCLFGPTSPRQWAPRGPQVQVIRKGITCVDCWPWHPGRGCMRGQECMVGISTEEVVEVATRLLVNFRRKCVAGS